MKSFSKIKALFANKALLDQALTHKSWVNENKNIRRTNERLEFLGDAVLEYVVSAEIFKKFPNEEEGFLTALRASLVNTTNLATHAQSAGIGDEVYFLSGADENTAKNISILADTVEAIIGALFIDKGISVVYQFITEEILSDVEEKIKKPLKDPKSRLQEFIQTNGKSSPKYKVVDEKGPDHNKEFTVEVIVDGKPLSQGQGKSKSEAEQNAAELALKKKLP